MLKVVTDTVVGALCMGGAIGIIALLNSLSDMWPFYICVLIVCWFVGFFGRCMREDLKRGNS